MTLVNVFLIEDDDINAKTTDWRLSKLGYTLSGRSSDGKDAIERITALKPDCVLIDINLGPDIDGITVAEQIRKTMDVPIIYLTARVDDAAISRAKKTRPSGYLVKPFNDKDLRVAIELAVNG